MARTFKVWASIERHDDQIEDDSQWEDNVGDGPAPVGLFDTLADAQAFVDSHAIDTDEGPPAPPAPGAVEALRDIAAFSDHESENDRIIAFRWSTVERARAVLATIDKGAP